MSTINNLNFYGEIARAQSPERKVKVKFVGKWGNEYKILYGS